MRSASIQERKQYWLYAHAGASFNIANRACEYLARNPTDKWLREALTGAIVVYYGRPFKWHAGKPGRDAVRLGDEFVPKPWRVLHHDLMQMRDQVFAHVDAGVPFDEHDLNEVRVSVKRGEATTTARLLYLRSEVLENIRQLIRELCQKAEYRSERLFRQLAPRRLGDGEYLADISTKTAAPLLRLPSLSSDEV